MGAPLALDVARILDTASPEYAALMANAVFPKTIPGIAADIIRCTDPTTGGSFPGFCKWIQIQSRLGGRSPFSVDRWHPEQRAFELDRTGRDIIVKSRQIGMSTAEGARDLFFALTHPHTKTLIVAHKEDVAKQLLSLIKDLYETLHDTADKVGLGAEFPSLKDTRGSTSGMVSQATRVRFNNGSSIECKTSGNSVQAASSLRGQKADRIHISEFAYWAFADDAMTALVPSIHSKTEVVIESTANGTGNAFHKWTMASLPVAGSHRGANGYRFHFYPWFFHPLNTRDLEPGEVVTPETGEEHTWQGFGATPEHLKFYRQTLISLFGNREAMRGEYPGDPMSAFANSGDAFMAGPDKERLGNHLREPVQVAFVDLPRKGTGETLSVALNLFREGVEVKGLGFGSVVIGVDCAGGVGGDNTALCVVGIQSGEILATVANDRIKPFEVAALIEVLCSEWFPGAMVIVEDFGPGSSALLKLNENGVVNLFTWGTYHTDNGGFKPDTGSQTAMFENLREWIQTGACGWLDTETFREVGQLVYDNGKVRAPGKSGKGKRKKEGDVRDDRAFALGLALWGRRECFGGGGSWGAGGPVIVHGSQKREFQNKERGASIW